MDISQRTIEAKLSGIGMRNLATATTSPDFEFIVGTVAYPCPWFVAAFLSPTVSRFHSIDPSMNKFHIRTTDTDHQFAKFISLGWGGTFEVSEQNAIFFRSIVRELGNSELEGLITDDLMGPLTLSNAFERLRECEFYDYPSDPIVGFLAAHFFEIDSIPDDISVSILSRILAHRSLRVLDEDWLFGVISSRIDLDPGAFSLFEFVLFEFMSVKAIQSFIELSRRHFERFNICIWDSVTSRLQYRIRSESCNLRTIGRCFPFDAEAPLDGMIAALTQQHRGNVVERGIVAMSGTVCGPESCYAPRNAADLTCTNVFYSKNEPNQWLCYDFMDQRVRPTHYTLHPHTSGYYTRSWVVEGSLDGLKWLELDRQNYNSDLDSAHPIGSFEVAHSMECRLVRLRQTANNARGDHFLILYAFELFGYLLETVDNDNDDD
jgi:hypothetical protein